MNASPSSFLNSKSKLNFFCFFFCFFFVILMEVSKFTAILTNDLNTSWWFVIHSSFYILKEYNFFLSKILFIEGFTWDISPSFFRDFFVMDSSWTLIKIEFSKHTLVRPLALQSITSYWVAKVGSVGLKAFSWTMYNISQSTNRSPIINFHISKFIENFSTSIFLDKLSIWKFMQQDHIISSA